MRKTMLRGAALPAGVMLSAGLALSVAGCFDVEESVSLQRDLSGRAGFTMTVDMEPMVQIVADLQHGMSGQPGKATPEEMASVRRDMLTKQETTGPNGAARKAWTEARKADVSQKLPPGVKLLSADVTSEGLKVTVRTQFAFDDIRKLARIDLPQSDNGPAAGAAKNPYSQPFSGLEVTDEGSTILVTMKGANPKSRLTREAGSQESMDPATRELVAAAFQKARFAFTLESPLEVVATNATRREGGKLHWEIRLSDPGAAALPDTLMARFKK